MRREIRRKPAPLRATVPGRMANGVALGELPGAEQVELDSAGDVPDGRLAGPAPGCPLRGRLAAGRGSAGIGKRWLWAGMRSSLRPGVSKEHRRVAGEVHDLVVVQLGARPAKPRVGGLGAGRAQPYGHRDFVCSPPSPAVVCTVYSIDADGDGGPSFFRGGFSSARYVPSGRTFTGLSVKLAEARHKTWASYCTSWWCCGVNSPGELAALAFDQPGVGGVGRVEQRDVLVVGLAGGEQPGAAPGLDGGDVHAEPVGYLGEGEQAAGAQPVGVAGQVVAAA